MVQRHDDPRGEPNWQPVTAVTMMAGMLTGQLAANREQLELLGRARREPWLRPPWRDTTCANAAAPGAARSRVIRQLQARGRIAGAISEQRLAVSGGNTRAAAQRPGGRTGLERRLDGGGDELRRAPGDRGAARRRDGRPSAGCHRGRQPQQVADADPRGRHWPAAAGPRATPRQSGRRLRTWTAAVVLAGCPVSGRHKDGVKAAPDPPLGAQVRRTAGTRRCHPEQGVLWPCGRGDRGTPMWCRRPASCDRGQGGQNAR